MLLQRRILDGIASGRILLVYRRWKKPTVKAGGRLRTKIGELGIDAVDRITLKEITDASARQAGFESRQEVLETLAGRDGMLYRIKVHLAGPDPRIALRTQSRVTKDELREIKSRLDRLDAASRRGPWTKQVLELIRDRPEVLAIELAESIGRDKPSFKADVRKWAKRKCIGHGLW